MITHLDPDEVCKDNQCRVLVNAAKACFCLRSPGQASVRLLLRLILLWLTSYIVETHCVTQDNKHWYCQTLLIGARQYSIVDFNWVVDTIVDTLCATHNANIPVVGPLIIEQLPHWVSEGMHWEIFNPGPKCNNQPTSVCELVFPSPLTLQCAYSTCFTRLSTCIIIVPLCPHYSPDTHTLDWTDKNWPEWDI